MTVFVNQNGEIKDVYSTENEKLVPVEMPEQNPFEGWSIAKICCYKILFHNGAYSGYAPYVDVKIIDHIDALGQQNALLAEQTVIMSSTVDSILTDIIPALMGL